MVDCTASDIPLFSIVVPVFNREWSVARALNSAVSFVGKDMLAEVIVIDDGSVDRSVDVVQNVFSQMVGGANISLRLIRHEFNRGVCAAKNTGGKAARGKWIVFLDSDDELIEGLGEKVASALAENSTCPLHFFLAVEEGKPLQESTRPVKFRTLNDILLTGTEGESLPIVKTEVFRELHYDEDIRGYESLCYMRIIRKHKFFCQHFLVARRYYVAHLDRLSSKVGMRSRTRDLRIGHLRVLSEHWRTMSIIAIAKQVARYGKALTIGY
jgi:glycosyltransferase involved in cell wall biosynthesis